MVGMGAGGRCVMLAFEGRAEVSNGRRGEGAAFEFESGQKGV